MNKQEAIEKVKEHGEFYSNAFGGTVKMVPVGPIIDIIYQIHEPQKVVVPKFVAEWYEQNKDDLNTAIYKAITEIYRIINSDNDDWLDTFEGWLAYEYHSISILVQMQLFGYEIEQEKLYTVEIPNPNSASLNLMKNKHGIRIDYKHYVDSIVGSNPETCTDKLTEAEIKQDFEWAWDAGFAKPVEVE